jgi:hypothetical protein
MADMIFTGKSRAVQLRAPEDRAVSRADALAAARQKRHQRELDAKRAKSAATIQRVWRGGATRSRVARELLSSAAPEVNPPLAWVAKVYAYFKRAANKTRTPVRPTPSANQSLGSAASAAAPALDRLEKSLLTAVARTGPDEVRAANLSSTTLLGFIDLLGTKVEVSEAVVASIVAAAGDERLGGQRCRILTALAAKIMAAANSNTTNSVGTAQALERVGAGLCSVFHAEADDADAVRTVACLLALPRLLGEGTARSGARIDLPTALFGPSWRSANDGDASKIRFAIARFLEYTAADRSADASVASWDRVLDHLLWMRESLLAGSDASTAATYARAVVTLMNRVYRDKSTGDAFFARLLSALQRRSDSSGSGESGHLTWLVQGGAALFFDAALTGVGEPAQRLAELDHVAEAYIAPYTSYLSGRYKTTAAAAGSGTTFTNRRAHAVPYISALAHHPRRLIGALWATLSATTDVWALRDRSGSLVLRYPNVITLFAHLSAVFLATAELKEYADVLGGTDSLRRMVIVLRDTVFLAVWNGPASRSGGGGVDIAGDAANIIDNAAFVSGAVTVLDHVHTADAATHIIRSHEWIAPRVVLPSLDQVTPEAFDGPAATLALNTLTAPSGTTSVRGRNQFSSSSDSDDERLAHIGPSSAGGGGAAGGGGDQSVTRFATLLKVVPFLVPFDARVKVFSRLLLHDRMADRGMGGKSIRVRRGHEFEDAFAKCMESNPRDIARVYEARFLDEESGREEMGFGQGVFRDFLFAAVQGGFHPNTGLFTQRGDASQALHIFPGADQVSPEGDASQRFAFLGRLLGRAIQDGVLVDVPLAGYVRNAILGKPNGFADLHSYDPEMFRHLDDLRSGRYTAEEVDAMGISFTHSEELFGVPVEVELLRGGVSMTVTSANVFQYCHCSRTIC